MKELIMLVGIPGSGKTTFAKKYLINKFNSAAYVSRDDIRFSFLKESDGYFEHEGRVFEKYIQDIQNAIENNQTIICDATHLTERARNKVLDNLDLSKIDNIKLVYFDIPIEKCLEYNELRVGRTKVPRGAIRRMGLSIEKPSYSEKYGLKYQIHTYDGSVLTPNIY